MTTFTWVAGQTGDWSASANWTSGTLPDSSASVLIPSGLTGYVSQIGTADNEIINALTLGSVTNVLGPTLEIGGTLQIAGAGSALTFVTGTIQVDSTGLFEGAAVGTFFSSPFTVSFINNGTVRADGGAGTSLQILSAFTNNGTLLADNGVLLLGGSGLSNLSGGTLTGGTYYAQGPAAGTFNQIEIGVNFDAVITTDAANIVLDGNASRIQGFSAGSFQPLEQQLQTIANNGTLQLLSGRGYSTSNAITDNGMLNLQGGTLATGTLTVGASGVLEGFGIVSNTVVDQGAVIASGGALDLAGGSSVTGVLTTMPGSTLILAGGTPSFISNNGAIYDTSGLLTINSLAGTGTLVVQNGATIDLAAATSQSVMFSGSNATLQLDAPSGYKGTLNGIGPGDKLILSGVTADTAHVVNGNTLAVISGGSTIDTFLLSGDYTGAAFSVTPFASGVTIQNTAGAPPRSDFQFNISFSDTAGLSPTEESQIVNDLSAAANDWAQYITGHAPLRIQLNISSVSSRGNELANAAFTSSTASGQVIGGQTIFVPSSIYALTTGNYISGTSSDITVNLPLTSGELGSSGGLYVNPTPFTSGGTIPANEFDLLTVFRHELAHGLGFSGFTNPNTGALGADVTLFDHFIQDTTSSPGTINGANFIGPNAETAYGNLLGTGATQVPLTLLNNGENFFHVANASGEPLGTDLMSGVGLTPGTSRDISSVDLAMLQDAGVPVSAAVVCYVRGTRIATPDGDVAIEDLHIGDCIRTAEGEHAPIVWIGHRRIDCRRHPHPDKVRPVRIRAHAFAPGLPQRDLLVSPQHAIFADGVLIPARCLINGRTVAQIDTQHVEYFHIELARHDLLLAEGMPAESYLDCGDRGMFDNSDGPTVLHADFASRNWEGVGCAELRLSGLEVVSVRRRLARRADALDSATNRAASA